MINLIKQLADLREKFSNSAENQDTVISALLGDVDISPGCITDGYGRTLSFEPVEGTNTYNVLLSTASDLEFETVISGTSSEIKIFFENAINNGKGLIQSPNYDMNLKTFISDATSGMNLNLTLAAILDKYTTSQDLTSYDLNEIISSLNLSSGQASQIQSMINLSADSNGKVDVYAFLQSLKSVCDKSTEVLEDGSLSLDTTEIPYLDNFLATAIPGVISSITSVISAVLTAVNAVVGAIIGVIGGMVSGITNAILNNVPSEVQLKNPASITNWFDGPATSRYDQLEHENDPSITSYINDGEVTIVRDGIFDACFFLNNDKENHVTKLACNRFITLALDRDKIWNWLSSHLSVSIQESTTEATVTLTRITPLTTPSYIPSNVYLDDYTEEVVKGYSGREISNYIVSCFGAYCLAEVMFMMKSNNKTSITFSWSRVLGTATSIDVLDGIFKTAANNVANDVGNMYFLNRIARGIQIWYYVKDTGWWHDFQNDSLTEIGLTECALCNNSAINYTTYVHTDTDGHNITTEGSVYSYQVSARLSYQPSMIYSLLQFNANGTVGIRDFYLNSADPIKLSTVPTSRMFMFAGYSETSLIIFATISAVLVAATMIAGTIVAKKIKKYKWKKQMKNKRDLMDVQAKYAKNPTDDNLDALYKAQKKYNFKAKLFGWDTYDAANNWWNPPATSSDNDSNESLLDLKVLIAG